MKINLQASRSLAVEMAALPVMDLGHDEQHISQYRG